MAENAFKADWPSFALGFNTGKSKGGGGAELNIHYSLDTPPEDTTKLWVKTSEASKVTITPTMKTVFDVNGEIAQKQVGNLPVSMAWHSSAAINNEVYFVAYNKKNIYKFDVETKTGITMPIEPTEYMNYPACVAVGNKFYIIGGQTTGSGGYTGLIRYYDPEENTLHEWHEQLPYAVAQACAVYKNGKIYVFGGSRSTASARKDIYVLNPETFKVEATYEMPAGRGQQRAAVYENYIYLFGGSSNASTAHNDIYRFDTMTGECVKIEEKFDTVSGIVGMACATVGNYAFLFGGSQRMGASVYANAYRFNMQTEVLENLGEFGKKGTGWTGEFYDNVIYLFGGVEGSNSSYLSRVLSLDLYSYSIPNGDLNIVPSLTNLVTLLDGSDAKIQLGVTSVYKGNEDNKGEQVEAFVCKDGVWTAI